MLKATRERERESGESTVSSEGGSMRVTLLRSLVSEGSSRSATGDRDVSHTRYVPLEEGQA